ncbi:MAG: UDP-glucose 4-epimerase GalE [Gammaproteobacteria bacterium]|nr:UDP-glucose 4-epimerase GalE [Gammaproteobacteria bacterium]
MNAQTILVTGGAGYIGSHVALQLRARGEKVIVLDNLSTGFKEAVLDAPLIIGDVGDTALVNKTIREHNIRTVMHFAASISVPESIQDPIKYYRNNTSNTRALLECCVAQNIPELVFSSTAAVYGTPENGQASEDHPTRPINPYGNSKLMSEWMLRDVSAVSPLRYVALRYFNVAGADTSKRIGQALKQSFHLVHVAAEHISGRRENLAMYGTNYDTPDGTAIRDYLHVVDLARAHLDALDYLRRGGPNTTLNVGYGHGYSVREVLQAAERVAGRPLIILEQPRRTGDPPVLIAQAQRIRQELGWEPQLDNLEAIVRSAIEWELQLRQRPWGA